MSAFNIRLKEFGNKDVPKRHLTLQKRIALDLLNRIVFRTPVDTGRARGGWQVSRGGPQRRLGEPDRDGSATVSRGESVVRALKPYNNLAIYNNVFYIQFLENGYSQQAPSGMVGISVAEVESQYGRTR